MVHSPGKLQSRWTVDNDCYGTDLKTHFKALHYQTGLQLTYPTMMHRCGHSILHLPVAAGHWGLRVSCLTPFEKQRFITLTNELSDLERGMGLDGPATSCIVHRRAVPSRVSQVNLGESGTGDSTTKEHELKRTLPLYLFSMN